MVNLDSNILSNANLPFRDISTIEDLEHYHSVLDHTSALAGDTEEGTAAAAGAIVGAAMVAAAYGAAAAATAGYAMLATALTAIGSTGIGLVVVVIIVIILVLITMASVSKMDRQVTEYMIYKDVPNSLMDTNGNYYETRVTGGPSSIAHFAGEWISPNHPAADTNTPEGYTRMIFAHSRTDTGLYESSDYKEHLDNDRKSKNDPLIMVGFLQSELDRLTHGDENGHKYGYPSCPWYNPWCKKKEHHYNEIVTNESLSRENVASTVTPVKGAPYQTTSKEKITKTMSTVYLGATNTLVILVPFAGDYKVEAYNKYDSLISSRTLVEASFSGVTDPNDLKFAQVNFGFSMNVAPGLTPGDNIDACLKDRAVEWGGGVSGVYFEAQRTNLSDYCQKSNNAYTKDQAMTKLFIQPLNMDRGFTYELIRPLAFPNRVWIATLDNKEVRHYRCYDSWPTCSDSEFSEGGE